VEEREQLALLQRFKLFTNRTVRAFAVCTVGRAWLAAVAVSVAVLFGAFWGVLSYCFCTVWVVVLLVGLVVLVILGRGDAWLLGWLLGLGFVYVFLGALGLGLVFGLFLGLGVGIILLEGLPSSCSTVAQTLLFRDAECNNKMPLQQIQQPIIKPAKRSFLKTAGIAIGGLILVLMTQQIFGNQQPLLESNDSQPTETSYNPNPSESNPINVNTRYAKLESLLKAQDFRAADEETDRVMLAVAKREEEGYLRREDAEKFPCKELRSIDQLWLKYSRGKFGISVQQQILKSLGGTKEFDEDVWRSFGYRVGWRNERGYTLPYNWLNFSQTAPSGHLPVVYCLWDGGYFPPVQTCKV
jgi:GUN4-like